jgi:hypothetical protein
MQSVHHGAEIMSIFREMHQGRHFESLRDYQELKRMLSEAISGGWVEQVPVMKPIISSRNEQWFRDRKTGEIFCLVAPGEKSRGWWTRIDGGDLVRPGESIH